MKGESREIRIKKISKAAFHRQNLLCYTDDFVSVRLNLFKVNSGDYVVIFDNLKFMILSDIGHLYSKRNWFYSKNNSASESSSERERASVLLDKRGIKKVYEIV